jgi:cytochrome c oxidase cbb3-type subunit 3
VASKYQPGGLQALFLYPGTLLHVPVSVTVQPADGQQVSGTIVAQDDFTIVVRETSGRIRSWRTDQIQFQISDPLSSHLDLLARYTDPDVHNVLAYLVTLK